LNVSYWDITVCRPTEKHVETGISDGPKGAGDHCNTVVLLKIPIRE